MAISASWRYPGDVGGLIPSPRPAVTRTGTCAGISASPPPAVEAATSYDGHCGVEVVAHKMHRGRPMISRRQGKGEVRDKPPAPHGSPQRQALAALGGFALGYGGASMALVTLRAILTWQAASWAACCVSYLQSPCPQRASTDVLGQFPPDQ